MLRPSLEQVGDARVHQPLLAYAMNVADKVQDLQDRLSCAAKQTLDRVFGALYDKMYRRDVLMEAWKRVRSKRKSLALAGVLARKSTAVGPAPGTAK